MHAHVVLRGPEGQDVELVPGDFVGRSTAAALQLDDGRVSEAHAMLTLREGQMLLLPLRGGLALAGEPRSSVVLTPGMVVELADGVGVNVVEVHLPFEVLGVEGDGVPKQMLPPVASVLLADGRLRITSGWRSDAAAQVWTTGEGYRLHVAGRTREIAAGEHLLLGERRLSFVSIPLGEAGPRTTRRYGDFADRLHLIARYDTVQLHREGRAPVIFSGMQARLLSELVAVNDPLSWSALTLELWPDEDDASLRRGRLDALLLRIRRRLRAAGIRADLVRTDGAGTIELVRYPTDVIEDLS